MMARPGFESLNASSVPITSLLSLTLAVLMDIQKSRFASILPVMTPPGACIVSIRCIPRYLPCIHKNNIVSLYSGY